MTAITYGKNRILREIPNEILKLTFLERYSIYNNNVSIDDKIVFSIIKPIVLMDTSLIGSISKKVSLRNATIHVYTNENLEYEYIIEVPDSAVENKEIISLSFLMYTTTMGFGGSVSQSAITNASNALLNAHTNSTMVTTNRMEIVGRNMFLVNTGSVQWDFSNVILMCGLSKDNNMSHLKRGSWLDFGKLCTEAAKIYIYNKLIVKLDEGYISGGHNISIIKSKVENYESALERYDELIEQWFKIEFMNDDKASLDLIELQLVR